MDFREEPLTDELANGDYTFDRSDLNQRTHAVVTDDAFDNDFDPFARIVNPRLNGPTLDIMNTPESHSLGTGWCRKCSTSAKMSGSDPKLWSRSGVCDTRGCPGYMGHPPAGRPQGRLGVTLAWKWLLKYKVKIMVIPI
eukprot:GFUD01088295.1.p1 GENE.GFUD01088295.1~~GFUD01088295.1.p1  ORF type:complete len:139 (-),score=22.49 GFUD01088295.1:109-525(-)